MTDCTFVTYARMPDLDPDDRLALDLIAQRGFSTAAAVWDDPKVNWSRAGTVVIRSTWDYNLRHEAFLAWAGSVAAVTSLYNPLPLLKWNIHKSYLDDLAAHGVAVVPTRWLPKGSAHDLAALLKRERWQTAVVKPGIGLSTHGVRRVIGTADDQSHVDALLSEHDVMLQPYMTSVQTYGERALMFIDGAFSHAARKAAFQPLLPTGEAGEVPAEATSAEIAVATQALQAVPAPALYARVDLVLDEESRPRVLELELIEPTLFLSMHPSAPRRFADAVMSLVA